MGEPGVCASLALLRILWNHQIDASKALSENNNNNKVGEKEGKARIKIKIEHQIDCIQ